MGATTSLPPCPGRDNTAGGDCPLNNTFKCDELYPRGLCPRDEVLFTTDNVIKTEEIKMPTTHSSSRERG